MGFTGLKRQNLVTSDCQGRNTLLNDYYLLFTFGTFGTVVSYDFLTSLHKCRCRDRITRLSVPSTTEVASVLQRWEMDNQ